MPWMRLDDRMAFHVKVLAAGNEAVGAWARAGAWSSGEGTDGHIPTTTAKTIATSRVWKKLCDAGLAHEVDGGFEIHDFLDYNPRSEKAAAKRSARAEAGRKGGLTKAANRQRAAAEACESLATELAIASHGASHFAQQTGKQNSAPIPIPIPDTPVAPSKAPPESGSETPPEPPSAPGADCPSGTRPRTSIDRFEEPFWISSYTEVVGEVLGRTWAFPKKQLSGLRDAMLNFAKGPNRDAWLRSEVGRFVRATRVNPNPWSSHGPDGFLRWLNGGARDDPDARPSAAHHVTASPAGYHAPAPKNPLAPPAHPRLRHPAHGDEIAQPSDIPTTGART